MKFLVFGLLLLSFNSIAKKRCVCNVNFGGYEGLNNSFKIVSPLEIHYGESGGFMNHDLNCAKDCGKKLSDLKKFCNDAMGMQAFLDNACNKTANIGKFEFGNNHYSGYELRAWSRAGVSGSRVVGGGHCGLVLECINGKTARLKPGSGK